MPGVRLSSAIKEKRNGTLNSMLKTCKRVINNEPPKLSLFHSPFTTLFYFLKECTFRFHEFRQTFVRNKQLYLSILCISLFMVSLNYLDGPHTEIFQVLKHKSLWWTWWIWLGFLSTCGFGSGLHTFVFYLGPFIAEVTMGAYECGSLNFPRPPYPERIICPEDQDVVEEITFLRIMRKVQFESVLWGLGTALGELPPYFMAKGARLSGRDNEELHELNEIIASDSSTSSSSQPISFHKKAELFLHRLVKQAGFLGILLCASVPNPLFDLAGMTCGHFLVPFWSFFGATFIGKAIIKVHLQQFTVIAVSSEHHVETLVDLMGRIPIFGKRLQSPFLEFIEEQKANLHGMSASTHQSWLQYIIFVVILTLICSFIISIVHAFAQMCYRREQDQKKRN